MLNKKEIGKRIALLRIHLQLSQTDFGKKIGVTRTSISNIERGDSFPSLELLTQIVTQFNVSFESIVLGKVTNTSPIAINNQETSNTIEKTNEISLHHNKELIKEKDKTIEILQSALSDKERLIKMYEKVSNL